MYLLLGAAFSPYSPAPRYPARITSNVRATAAGKHEGSDVQANNSVVVR